MYRDGVREAGALDAISGLNSADVDQTEDDGIIVYRIVLIRRRKYWCRMS